MDEQIEIQVITDNAENLPTYTTAQAAGADVKAANKDPIVIPPGGSALVPTGLKVAIPAGYEIQARPRSGLALKNQITLLNTPGTIDADYRGEIGIIMINHGKENFTVTYGMRIAQLVVARALQARFVLSEGELTATSRGGGGFGHTGI